jgi:hypothetical protein
MTDFGQKSGIAYPSLTCPVVKTSRDQPHVSLLASTNRCLIAADHVSPNVFDSPQNRYIRQKGRDRRLLRRLADFPERQSQISTSLSRQSDFVACYVEGQMCSEKIAEHPLFDEPPARPVYSEHGHN